MPNITRNEHPLKIERKRRNLSQKALGDFAGGLSQWTIIRAEKGERIGPDARQQLCNFLGKSAIELGLLPQVEPVLTIGNPLDTELSRRQVLQTIGVAGAALVTGAAMHAERWKQLSKNLGRSQVSTETISHLYAITQNYWSLRASIPALELLIGVQGHLQTTSQLLKGSLSPANRNDLCGVSGEIGLIAGQICFDMNEYDTARNYYKDSYQAGIESDNIDLQCVALARMSFTYIEDHQFSAAQVLLMKAENLAADCSSMTIKCWLKAIEAEIYANMRKSKECMLALEDMENAASTTKWDTDVYKTGFNKARMAGYKGVCFVRLEKPDYALAALTEALAIDSQALRHRLRVSVNMATAYIQQGEIEQGCKIATSVLETTKQTRTLLLLPRLEKFRQTVNRWQNEQCVRDFDEHLLLA